MSSHEQLTAAVSEESRRHYAAFALFNQAMADHLGLHPTDLQCLSLLSLDPTPRTAGQIAALTGLTSGSATRLVDRLERSGLVTRTPDPEDRRRIVVQLTETVEGDVGAAWDEPSAAFGAVLEGYTASELEVIRDYLQRTADVGREQALRIKALAR